MHTETEDQWEAFGRKQLRCFLEIASGTGPAEAVLTIPWATIGNEKRWARSGNAEVVPHERFTMLGVIAETVLNSRERRVARREGSKGPA
jgi:hypothetical protein